MKHVAKKRKHVDSESAGPQVSKKSKKATPKSTGLEEMDVEQFLAGGFLTAAKEKSDADVQALNGKKREKKQKKKKQDANSISGSQTTSAGRKAKQKEGQRAEKAASSLLVGAPASTNAAKESSKPRKNQKSEAKEHADQLEALRTKDPEFYEYLQATDKDLLDFDMGAGSSGEDSEGSQEPDGNAAAEDSSQDEPDADSEADADNVPAKAPKIAELNSDLKAAKQSKGSKWGALSQDVVDQWCKDAKEHRSVAALEKLVKAYRVACHLGDEEDDMSATMRITSSTVFNKVLVFVIKEAGGLIRQAMGLPEGKLTVEMVKKAKRWHKLENTVKSFLGNSLHLLGQMTEEAMTEFLLRHLRPSVPFLISSERTQRKFLKQALGNFGEGGMKSRIQAFLFVREMAISLPAPNLTLAMKGVYRQFVLNAKFMSLGTLPNINFMANCVVDLYGLDMAASYETAFEYLRQLATIIRGGLSQKTKEAYKEVYCWQTISSLELWAKVISTYPGTQELRQLVHPIVQLLTAVIRLLPTPKYYPLRLRCIRSLNKLSEATKLYIPVSPLLVESLQWSKLHKAAKPGGRKLASSVPQLRASKQDLESSSFQQSFVEEVFLLLAEHLAQWSCNVAFPEISFITSYQVNQILKACKVEKFRGAAKGLTAAINANSEYVIKHRRKLDCSPKDSAVLAKFLSSETDQAQAPMRKYAKTLREKWDRQQTAAATSEVRVMASDQDLDSADELPDQGLLPKLRKDAQLKKQKAAAPPPPQEPLERLEQPDLDAGDDLEDDVKDFEFSDSDNE